MDKEDRLIREVEATLLGHRLDLDDGERVICVASDGFPPIGSRGRVTRSYKHKNRYAVNVVWDGKRSVWYMTRCQLERENEYKG